MAAAATNGGFQFARGALPRGAPPRGWRAADWADPPPNPDRAARLAQLVGLRPLVGTVFILRSSPDGGPVHVQVEETLSMAGAGAEATPAEMGCYGRVTSTGSPLYEPDRLVAFPLTKVHVVADFHNEAHHVRQIESWLAEWDALAGQ